MRSLRAPATANAGGAGSGVEQPLVEEGLVEEGARTASSSLSPPIPGGSEERSQSIYEGSGRAASAKI